MSATVDAPTRLPDEVIADVRRVKEDLDAIAAHLPAEKSDAPLFGTKAWAKGLRAGVSAGVTALIVTLTGFLTEWVSGTHVDITIAKSLLLSCVIALGTGFIRGLSAWAQEQFKKWGGS